MQYVNRYFILCIFILNCRVSKMFALVHVNSRFLFPWDARFLLALMFYRSQPVESVSIQSLIRGPPAVNCSLCASLGTVLYDPLKCLYVN
jgi:hypothetical protein